MTTLYIIQLFVGQIWKVRQHLDQSSLDPIKHFHRSSPLHGGVNTNRDDSVDDDYDNDVISDYQASSVEWIIEACQS